MEKNYDKYRELRELERRYKLFYEYAPLPYQSLDENVNIIDINQAWLDFLGYDKEEVIGKCFGEFLVLKSRELLNSRFSHFKEIGVIQDVEYEIIKKDGIHRIIWLDGRIAYDKNGNFTQAHCFFKDITERKKVEKELLVERDKLINILNSIEDGVYIVDSNYNIEYVNPILIKEFGRSEGKKCYKYFDDLEEVCPFCRNQEVFKGKIVRGEWYSAKNQKTYDLIDTPLKNVDGSVSKLTIFRDISEKKKVEQELKESEERYRNAYDKADFYKDLLAHDVSNIFNNIKASVQLMKIWKEDYDVSKKERKMIEIIKQQLERGASLVSNVRKLSEIEEGEMSLKSVDVINVIENSIENVLSRFQDREIEIKVEKTNEISNIKGGDLLIGAFENILINGALYNESDMIRIRIKVSEVYKDDEKFVKIEFKDNGFGIIDGRKKAIFERNYKTDRSTGGMGIGLSLVKTIINSYDGQVWVDNRVMGDYTKGSNFIILLKQS